MPAAVLGLRMSEARGSTHYDAVPLSSEQESRFLSENMRRIFLLIYRKVGNVEDAKDLTQEAFIKALQRQDQLKDMDKAAHWLSRIATNTAIDFLRRSGRVAFTDLEDMPEPFVTSPAESPEQRMLRNEHRERAQTLSIGLGAVPPCKFHGQLQAYSLLALYGTVSIVKRNFIDG